MLLCSLAGASNWTCASPSGDPWSATCASWASLLPRVGCAASGADCILLMDLLPSGSTVPSYSSFELFAPPKNMSLPKATVSAQIGTPAPDGLSVPITLTGTGGVALFVGLVTTANGRFSNNYFNLLPGATTVQFLSFGPLDLATLQSTLRVEHVAGYF